MRLLIVDDSEADRKLIEQSLAHLHPKPEIEIATRGEQCIEKLGAPNPFDLVFLDFHLPDTTGLEILKRIRSARPDQPIVMITAVGSETVAVEAIRAGADDYVIKRGDYAPLLPVVVQRIQEKVRLRDERRNLARASQREEERKKFETIVEYMGEGVVLTNERGEVEVMNPTARKILGIGAHQHGVELTQILLTKLGFSPEEPLGRDPSAEFRKSIEILGRTYSCILTRVATAQDARLTASVMVLRDVTKERELDRIRSDFVSFASHELRTPLTAIKNAVDIVARGMAGPVTETQARFLRIANESASRLAKLINDILDFSRIESGRMELRRRDVDPLALLKQVLSLFESQARAKPIDLDVRLPPSLPHLHADPDRLSQIVSNLLHNAIKFTPAGGRVSLVARAQPWEIVAGEIPANEMAEMPQALDVLEIRVTDTGPGIPREEQRKIFDIYRQLGSQYKDHAGGTGLGLPITKHLVRLHHGLIRLATEVDKGSDFRVLIPVLQPETIFAAELTRDIALARENHSLFSLLVARLDVPGGAESLDSLKAIAREAREIVEGVLYRDTDKVDSRPREGRVLTVVKLRDTSKGGAKIVADRVLHAFSERKVFAEGRPVDLSAYVDIVSYPEDGGTAAELLRAARLGMEI